MLSARWVGVFCVGCALVLTACGGKESSAGGTGGAEEMGGAAGIPTSDCKTDIDCDDGLYCTGTEKCQVFDGYKLCVSGEPVECDDGIACTVDSCNENRQACQSRVPDEDGDGHGDASCVDDDGAPLGDDCDDSDPNSYPGNEEVCDAEGRDEDCDPNTYGQRDVDADGHDDAMCCNGKGRNKVCGDDCDDFDPSTRPGQVEICDEKDNNCDGEIDEGTQISGYLDADGDQHGDPNQPIMACDVSARFSVHGDDCDDGNISRFGTHPEICDSIDNDCDGIVDDYTLAVTWYVDEDDDGFGDATGGTVVACDPQNGYSILPIDCDDSAAGVNPGAEERCDGLDNDCNGAADYFLGVNDSEDDDRDGHVDARCGGVGDDCDDTNAAVHPGAVAQCDGLDNDCDGDVDDDVGERTWYADVDGDGYGDGGVTQEACQAPPGFVARDGDCDDSTASKHPGAPDLCGGGDEDCDGEEDENAVRFAFYADADGDGAGGGDPLLACTQPEGYGLLPTDCDDSNALRYEGNPEVCDNIDNDCDGDPDNDPTLCDDVGTEGTCTAGSCVIDACLGDYLNCDADPQNGCEANTQTDVNHCGACDDACPAAQNATSSCEGGECELECEMGFVDCDQSALTGCEANFLTDPANCGGCDLRCDGSANAPAVCNDGSCERTCDDGFLDCDSDIETNGCEVQPEDDRQHCGGCGVECESNEVCSRGLCQPTAWVSTGSDGAFMPTEDTVLAAGLHHFTHIYIPVGVTVTTDGDGVLEIYASGDVVIDGTISVNGSSGGNGSLPGINCGDSRSFKVGGGGRTGSPLYPGADGSAIVNACPAVALGGLGGNGVDGAGTCGAGGLLGGGMGAACPGGGGGGGGYAGGAGGSHNNFLGGPGGSVTGVSTGGWAAASQPGEGGESGLAFYGGGDGTAIRCAGGGSIGLGPALDLAVATYFTTGSGGGGGGAAPNGGLAAAGAGGGGGGGALRIAAEGFLQIGLTGVLSADGGRGGAGASTQSLAGAGGGGSGGLIFLAAREFFSQGQVLARGGAGGSSQACNGGAGGRGRIRLSVLPERCDIEGTFFPPLVNECDVTDPGEPGFTYIDTYPF